MVFWPVARNCLLRTLGWFTTSEGMRARGGRVLRMVCTGICWLVLRSCTVPDTVVGASALFWKLIESTFVCAPMLTESARCGTPARIGGPQYAKLVKGAGPGMTWKT